MLLLFWVLLLLLMMMRCCDSRRVLVANATIPLNVQDSICDTVIVYLFLHSIKHNAKLLYTVRNRFVDAKMK